MKQIVDRKRAASGERGEDEGMVLAPVQSLVAALRPPSPEQHRGSTFKTSVGPPEAFKERRGAFKRIPFQKPIPHHLRGLINDLPARLSATKHRHVNDDREMVVTIGPTDRTDGRQMNLDEIHFWDFLNEPMAVEDSERVVEKLHPLVYKLQLTRGELSTDTVVFELGLYSRVIGSDRKDYIGKTKVFFPRPHDDLVLWINLAAIR